MKVPNSFKLSELAEELKQRDDQYHSLSMMSYAIVPGDGCPCDDCKKDRREALNELNKQIHEQNKRLVHQNCPQRIVHDLNQAEQIVESVKTENTVTVTRPAPRPVRAMFPFLTFDLSYGEETKPKPKEDESK